MCTVVHRIKAVCQAAGIASCALGACAIRSHSTSRQQQVSWFDAAYQDLPALLARLLNLLNKSALWVGLTASKHGADRS